MKCIKIITIKHFNGGTHMAVTIFAAIDVGSHETTLRIYEVSKKYGVHEIESVHHTARLGL